MAVPNYAGIYQELWHCSGWFATTQYNVTVCKYDILSLYNEYNLEHEWTAASIYHTLTWRCAGSPHLNMPLFIMQKIESLRLHLYEYNIYQLLCGTYAVVYPAFQRTCNKWTLHRQLLQYTCITGTVFKKICQFSRKGVIWLSRQIICSALSG